MVPHRLGWLDPVFVALSVIGYSGLVWIAIAPLIAYLARRNVLSALGLTAASVWSADLISLGIKSAADRPRPIP